MIETCCFFNLGFLLVKLKSSLRKFYGHHHDLVDHYGISVSEMTTICSTYHKHFPVLSSFMTYHWLCNQINTTGVTSGSGIAYPSGTHEFISGFSRVRATRSLVLYVCFVDSFFVILSFFFWSLCCLSFFDLRILITPLVSSNSSS